MYEDEDDQGVLEPPRFDMLTVKFRGDNYTIALPYCEVANGDISSIADGKVNIAIPANENEPPQAVEMLFADFVKLIEQTFDIKEIVQLSLQMADSYDNISIL